MLVKNMLVRNMLIRENADQENTEQENANQENTDQENTDQENADQEIYWPGNFWSERNTDQEITDKENADQENADQEKYWSAKLSLCTSAAVLASPFPHVANLFGPKVSKSTKMSVSQPKMVVVYLCGGSGKPSRDVALSFSPKNQNVSKSTNYSGGGVLTADSLIYLPRSVAKYTSRVAGQMYLLESLAN